MAQWNGVKVFEAAGQSVVTGCTSQPLPRNTFCSLHQGEATPVAEKVTNETRSSLRLKKKKQATNSDDNLEDHLHIVESILDITTINGKQMFKVKWFGYPEEDATIEPEENIPKFIQNFYSVPQNLGKRLPNPKIKQSKKLTNGTTYHYLTWEGEEGGTWIEEDFFSMVGDKDAEFSQNLPVLTCGTRKSRDKRICRYNVGIFLGAFPCTVNI